jgi:hypothetical protein
MCEKKAIGDKKSGFEDGITSKDNPRCSRPLRRLQVAQHARGAFKPCRRHSPCVIAPMHEGACHVSSELTIEFTTRPSML